jgi:aryl-alcohol dehydrogenase-like predicted oxidoreductase
MPADRRETLLADATMDVVDELERFVQQQGHSLLELAIAWLAAKAVVASVIAGATRPEQVIANVRAADWVLTEEELQAVDRIAPPPSPTG